MSATAAMPDTATDLEDRASIESLETLHHERRVLIRTLAPLKAVHGSFGMWDAKRKQMSRAMMVKAKMDMQQRGEKVTDMMIEAHALTDPQFVAFLDQGERDRIEYLTQQPVLDEIEERIRNREIALQAYNSELRLAR
jgi:hypothetical protein